MDGVHIHDRHSAHTMESMLTLLAQRMDSTNFQHDHHQENSTPNTSFNRTHTQFLRNILNLSNASSANQSAAESPYKTRSVELPVQRNNVNNQQAYQTISSSSSLLNEIPVESIPIVFNKLEHLRRVSAVQMPAHLYWISLYRNRWGMWRPHDMAPSDWGVFRW